MEIRIKGNPFSAHLTNPVEPHTQDMMIWKISDFLRTDPDVRVFATVVNFLEPELGRRIPIPAIRTIEPIPVYVEIRPMVGEQYDLRKLSAFLSKLSKNNRLETNHITSYGVAVFVGDQTYEEFLESNPG